MKRLTEEAMAFQAGLLHEHRAPSYSPADAKVEVTLFFDYHLQPRQMPGKRF